MTPALVQKYLAVIDLTAGEASDSFDQSAMLTALVDRLKGIAQALTSLGGVGRSMSQADNSTVSDLYTWYVFLPSHQSLAYHLKDKCPISRTPIASDFACTECFASAPDCSDGRVKILDRPPNARNLPKDCRACIRCDRHPVRPPI